MEERRAGTAATRPPSFGAVAVAVGRRSLTARADVAQEERVASLAVDVVDLFEAGPTESNRCNSETHSKNARREGKG
jgi:hypothetical protein